MHCKHCGALMDEQQKICPECGTNQSEEVQTLASQQEEQVFDMPITEEVTSEAVSAPKKHRLGLIALILALCTVLGVVAVIFLGRDKKPYAGPLESDKYVVAELGNHKLTNQTFQYYYWAAFYQLYSQYGTYITQLGLDMNKPFEDQKFGSDGSTWADFFTDYALRQWTWEITVAEAAKADGFTLSEAQQGSLQAMLDAVETDAVKNGYTDKVDYLKHAFDLSADWESYVEYTTLTYINSRYVVEKQEQFSKEGAADPKGHKDIYYIAIRHALIRPEDSSDAAKAAAKAKAEQLYEEFKKNPTMEAFVELAKKHSADGSAANGGLIEGVYPGQMVENFDKWCFTEGRQVGDHGLIETEYGWHLMFFDGYLENIYKTAAQCYAEEAYTNWQSALLKDLNPVQYRDHITFRHAEK